ncbi:receptor-type tyrosine-protein phosphatase [Holotrichia oblita]|uniref:Receptor-type tyrosine-protein phosphatase n=1 Tax=Holotrichia oblita TaxID=644536 RepID=A0ACB9TKY1_HOLOL|nr:receptor-type tyrosine-protein phosphatase [Holotrichia oblita]
MEQTSTGCTFINTHSSSIWIDDFDFEPILDYRWEGIEGTELTFNNPVDVYQTSKDSFRISFSFKGVEIHILLCDRQVQGLWKIRYGNCYWIGFGADKGVKNFLRKCKEGEIPDILGIYASSPCSASKHEVDGWQRKIFKDKDGNIGSNSKILITSLQSGIGSSYIGSTIQNCGSGDFTCPINTIGEDCLPCTSFNENDCETSKLCYTTLDRVSKCFCAAGYQGTNCQTHDIKTFMKVNPKNTSIIITINANRPTEFCPLSEFRLCLYQNQDIKNCSQDFHFSVVFENLEPNEEYRLLVYRNENYVKEWTEKTLEGAPEEVQNLRLDGMSNTSLELSWHEPKKKNEIPTKRELPQVTFVRGSRKSYLITFHWNCIDIEGTFQFTAILICNSEWCVNKTQNIVEKATNFKESLTYTVPVFGYTNYTVRMFIVRNNANTSKDTTIQTSPTEPGPVRNVTIYSKTNTSVSVRWLPPDPPMGEIDHYLVTTVNPSTRDKVMPGTSECEIWPGQICKTISNLQNVKAKNANVVEYGNEADVHGVVAEEVSEPPQNIMFEWDNEYGLTLFWQHPDKTNGPLQQFLITFNNTLYAIYNVSKEEAQYKCELKLTEEFTSQDLIVAVKAKNSVGSSDSVQNSTYTPPKTPEFEVLPYVENKTNTAITIKIPLISKVDGDRSNMYIIITDLNSNQIPQRVYFHPLEQQLLKDVNVSDTNSWIAGEFNLAETVNRQGFLFQIGNDIVTDSISDKRWKLKNNKLNSGNTYIISIVLNNTFKVFTRLQIYKLKATLPPTAIGNLVNGESNKSSEQAKAKHSNPIKICNLNEYTKKSIEDGEFEKQYGMLQTGQTRGWTTGTQQENRSKNRIANLVAYDHSRVKLKVVNNDPFSDYINANYIDGYKSKNAYIATQTPKANTMNDFWRMIWQEKVAYIIMIASADEVEKEIVAKYWPDINKIIKFNNIIVKYINVVVTANYEIRDFNVSHEGQMRTIQQYHFLTWPAHGVPLYVQNLSIFLKKIFTIPQSEAPLVVHCSSGVGRTGSVILCDICMRMAIKEDQVDVLHHLYKLREQRVNMVENVEQYKLIHLVLLQSLVAFDTGVLCNEAMQTAIETRIAVNISVEMQYLEESAWQDDAMRKPSFRSDLPVVSAKNRFNDILPDVTSRICLTAYPSSDPTSTYINAVAVDGFATPAKFIVTQHPLNSTIGDFWRLIEERKITMIVCLNVLNLKDNTSCIFYPTVGGRPMKPVPYLEIKFTDRTVKEYFEIYTVTMTNLQTLEEDIHIKILHLSNWHYAMIHPENSVDLVTTYAEMNRLGRNSDNILITCHDGAKACGLYVAMCFVIDQIKMEQICDVCLAVRTVRRSRKQFVMTSNQYIFLYKCALEYVRQFDIYSNFNSTCAFK